jgi:hypothetical protein
MQHCSIHLSDPSFLTVRCPVQTHEPSLRRESFYIVAEYLLPTMDDPRVATDHHTPRYEVTRDVDALGRCDALKIKADGRMDAEGFFDDGVQVW